MLELRSIDLRFLFKKQPAKTASKDIALINIDEKSYKNINQPIIFYHTYIAQMIDFLVESGVRVIGLDIQLPSISLEERVKGGYDSVYTKAILDAKKRGVDVVLGFSSKDSAPLWTYMAAAGQDNLAVFNLTQDKDDFIRRQELWFEENGRRYPSFPYLLANKFSGSGLQVPASTILIDYSLSAGIPNYAFDEIYRLSQEGPDRKDLFKDKVVIIGTLFIHEDKHPTPLYYSSGPDKGKRTAGTLIQATTLNTLLSKSFFREPSSAAGAVYILIIAILSVFLCFNRRPISAGALCLLEAVAILLVSIYAFDRLYVIRLTPLFLTVLSSYGITTVFHYYTEEKNKKLIRSRFASYVPEKVIDRIIDKDIRKLMEGEHKELALFFSDIRGFTAYSENNKNQPTRVVNFLNDYHKETTDIILANNGTVAQLTGDGVFAFFGAPVEFADPVLAAVKSAIEIRQRIAELKARWQEFGVEDLKIGIGIHFGDAIVGNIGSLKKMAYVAIGDNTNVASRVEGLTKEFRETILISQAAYERVKDKIIARPLGEAKIKGHSEITVFAVDGLSKPA
jgi:class 3 adenylate cyclase/CHASE2 domain-containing sensor protein